MYENFLEVGIVSDCHRNSSFARFEPELPTWCQNVVSRDPDDYFDATAALPTPGCCPVFRQRRRSTVQRHWCTLTSRHLRTILKWASWLLFHQNSSHQSLPNCFRFLAAKDLLSSSFHLSMANRVAVLDVNDKYS